MPRPARIMGSSPRSTSVPMTSVGMALRHDAGHRWRRDSVAVLAAVLARMVGLGFAVSDLASSAQHRPIELIIGFLVRDSRDKSWLREHIAGGGLVLVRGFIDAAHRFPLRGWGDGVVRIKPLHVVVNEAQRIVAWD